MTIIAEHERLITEVAETISDSTTHDVVSIREAIKSFSPATLNRITGFGLRDWQREELLGGMIFFGWNESCANDYLSMSPIGMSCTLSDIDKHIDALRFYEGMVQQSGETYPEERADQIVAIVRVLLQMHERDENILVPFNDGGTWKLLPYLNYAPLRDLLVHSPQRDAVVKIVIERDIMDAELITEMISTASPSLIEGTL